MHIFLTANVKAGLKCTRLWGIGSVSSVLQDVGQMHSKGKDTNVFPFKQD